MQAPSHRHARLASASAAAAVLTLLSAIVAAAALLSGAAGARAEGSDGWEVVREPSYLDAGLERRANPADPSQIDEREIPAFGPSEQDRPRALSGDGNYGDGTYARPVYTRPYELRRLTPEDEEKRLYQSVPIGFDNPVNRGHDIAVRYEGDAPVLALVHMGKGTNLWKGWTTKYADVTVEPDDGSGQSVAIYSWGASEDKWGRTLDEWKQGLLDAGEELSPFDCIVLTVGAGKSCRLSEIVSLTDEPRETPEMRPVDRDMAATEVVADMRAGYNLSGHMESHWEAPEGPSRDGGWGRSDLELEAHWSRGTYIDRQTLHDIRERGFRTVRLPVSWAQHVYPLGDEPYHIDRAWMARVREVVDWCLAEDLYIVLNTHHETWLERRTLGSDYEEISEELVAIWRQIADEFAGYDQRLVFEGMNEPHSTGEGASGFGTPTEDEMRTVERLNEDFVATIRSIGQDDPANRHLGRIIMVTPYAGSGDAVQDRFSELVENTLMTDYPSPDRLVVSAHSYAPHAFTHFGNDLTLEETIPLWQQNAYTEAYRDSQDRAFHRLRRCYTDRDIPVILGEFGSYYCGEGRQADRLAWMTTHVTYLKELGIPGLIWNMDRSWSGTNRKAWNVYDEDGHEWSPQSEAMLDRWFEILSDDGTIPWGRSAGVGEGEHAPLADGIPLMGDDPADLDRGGQGDDSFRLRLTPQAGSGLPEWRSSNRDNGTIAAAADRDKEIAVRFEGDVPYLWLCSVNDAGWKNWQTIEPRDVIGGVAYWPCDAMWGMWCERDDETSAEEPKAKRDEGQLTVAYVATRGRTVVSEAALLDARACEWGEWEVAMSPTCEGKGREESHGRGLPRRVRTREAAPLGHAWGSPSYEWGTGHATCRASRSCDRCGREETEEVSAAWVPVAPAGVDREGTAEFHASFEGEGFSEQVVVAETPKAFVDVTNGKTPHQADIEWLAMTGISTGWERSDGRREFRPYAGVTRCDMTAFLFRLARKWGVVDDSWQPDDAQRLAFSDVNENTPHAREVWWLASRGISGGWEAAGGKREFRPYAMVARQDMAAFLFRLANAAGRGGAGDSWQASEESKARFRDVSATAADNHHDEVWWLAERGVSTGWDVGDGKYEFRGLLNVARCDMAAFLRRMDGLA